MANLEKDYTKYNLVNVYTEFSKCDKEGKVIVDNLVELSQDYIRRNFAYDGFYNDVEPMSKKDYKEKNDDLKYSILEFCAVKVQSNLLNADVSTPNGVRRAFSNTAYSELYNSIIVEAIQSVVLNANPAIIANFCTIEDVEVSGMKSFEIEPKGLMVAQRTSYNNNVTLLDGYTKQSVQITPKPYTAGSQIDYLRILDGVFDFGKEIARVAMSLLYAQYKLVVGILFDSAKFANTPFYINGYTGAKVIQVVEYMQALNGGSPVKAYGLLSTFNTAGTISTTNFGFETQDQMIRDGFIGRANGIDNIVIPQATDLSAPFIDANLDSLLLVPKNKMVLLSDVGSKPIMLVRERFVHAISKDPLTESILTQSYAYTMSFDAGLATQAIYAIVQVQ